MSDTAYAWAGAALAGLAVAGSLYLSMGMGLAACPLCYYQRAFAMAAFAVLLVGAANGVEAKANLPGLALPLALAGLAVAGWHVRLELSGRMECPAGMLGVGSAPQQSLAAFVLLSAVLMAGAFANGLPGSGWRTALLSAGLGVLLAAGCLLSVAMPPRPGAEEYEKNPVPKTCRPPRPAA